MCRLGESHTLDVAHQRRSDEAELLITSESKHFFFYLKVWALKEREHKWKVIKWQPLQLSPWMEEGKKTCFREISLIIGTSSRVSAWFVYCSEKNSALKLFPLMDKVGHPLWAERRLLDKNKGTCNVKFKRTYWNENQNKTRANVYFLYLLLFLEKAT